MDSSFCLYWFWFFFLSLVTCRCYALTSIYFLSILMEDSNPTFHVVIGVLVESCTKSHVGILYFIAWFLFFFFFFPPFHFLLYMLLHWIFHCPNVSWFNVSFWILTVSYISQISSKQAKVGLLELFQKIQLDNPTLLVKSQFSLVNGSEIMSLLSGLLPYSVLTDKNCSVWFILPHSVLC